MSAMKKPWPDGRTHSCPLSGRLSPPARGHLAASPSASRSIRWSVRRGRNCAPASSPSRPQGSPRPRPPRPIGRPKTSPSTPSGPTGPRRSTRLPWADLLQRVFAEDVLCCPCGGRRRVLGFITDTDVARAILTALGLPAIPSLRPLAHRPSRPSTTGRATSPTTTSAARSATPRRPPARRRRRPAGLGRVRQRLIAPGIATSAIAQPTCARRSPTDRESCLPTPSGHDRKPETSALGTPTRRSSVSSPATGPPETGGVRPCRQASTARRASDWR